MRRPLLAALVAAAMFAAATPWVLRPWFLADDALPRAAGRQGALLDADLYLNVWILAWIAHAATTDPARLFDGNIYAPAPNTIAGSEHMLAHLPVTAPVLAATGNALTVLKAMALESFVLSGVAMFLLVFHHTRDPLAALVAGAAWTFAPWRVRTLPQPQYLGAQYLPLALLAVDCWLAAGRRRALAGLALAAAAQALACFYLGYFTFVAVPIYALARLRALPAAARPRAVAGVGAGLVAGALLAAPAGLPYLAARATRAIPTYDAATLVDYSATPRSWLELRTFTEVLGPAPVVLVLLGLVARFVRRLRRGTPGAGSRGPEGAMLLLLGAAVVLSWGPYLHLGSTLVPLPYLVPWWLVPGFASMRGPVRFVIVAAAAVAALTGYLLARGTAGWSRRARVGAALLLVAACALGAAPVPAPVMAARLGAHAEPAARWLAAQPRGGTVLELPASTVNGDFQGQLRAGRHMLASTVHWLPIVDGYTAYPPPTAALFAPAIAALPDPAALALLGDGAGLRWIVVHEEDLPPRERARWSAAAGVTPAATFGPDRVYEVTRAPARPWRAEIVERLGGEPARTLAGTPTTPLAPVCRPGRILPFEVPPLLPAPTPTTVPVTIENASPCTWPGVAVHPRGLVGIAYHWVDPQGRTYPPGPFARLLADVPPATTATTRLAVFPPGTAGRWRLEAALVQDGDPAPLATASVPVEVRNWPAQPGPGAKRSASGP